MYSLHICTCKTKTRVCDRYQVALSRLCTYMYIRMYVHSKRIGYDVGTTQRMERERLIGLLRDEHQLRALDISRAFLLVCRV